MSKHHYFFAVKLPKEAKEFLYEWIQARKGDFPFARWVHPEDYHITLAFLGFAEKKKLEQAIEKVKPILEKEVSFTLTLNSIGVFGPQKAPRIFGRMWNLQNSSFPFKKRFISNVWRRDFNWIKNLSARISHWRENGIAGMLLT